MAIKAIVDAARALPGYGGLAVISRGELLFIEYIELDHLLRMYALYDRVCEKLGVRKRLCAVAGGFTFHVYDNGGLTIVVRMAGRFCPVPRLIMAESDFVDPSPSDLLPSREEIRHEAEALLQQYDLLG
jgi:hypothetical protein